MKPRNILLLEPNYKNKYPPLGLMKLSTYHRMIGDQVSFFKGTKREFFKREKRRFCISQLRKKRPKFRDRFEAKARLYVYLDSGDITALSDFLSLAERSSHRTVASIIEQTESLDFTRLPNWDRIYISSLFTFNWKETVECISWARELAKDENQFFVGGVMATLIPDLLAEETGFGVGSQIKTGLLDSPGLFDRNHLIIDELTPDYSILESIPYRYAFDTGYLSYMTRGCTRTCSFCAVPKIEPTYKPRVFIRDQISHVEKEYEPRRNLTLMDNNVLGSPDLSSIVQEIQDMGFTKDAIFFEQPRFPIVLEYFQSHSNELNREQFRERLHEELRVFNPNRIRKRTAREEYHQLLAESGFASLSNMTSPAIRQYGPRLAELMNTKGVAVPKKRYVDFNQGIDCRYLNEENMQLLGQLPLHPMRIAFDHIGLRKQYENAIRLAVKHGIRRLSNYILYNYMDKPEDLWTRLEINIQLNKQLDVDIYSFPMKFIPLFGNESKDRRFIGKHWSRKKIRAIQCILNVTRGIVMHGEEFFLRAFGKDIDEFSDILLFPESYILNRGYYEEIGKTKQWKEEYENLNEQQRSTALSVIGRCEYSEIDIVMDRAVKSFLQHYKAKYLSKKETENRLKRRRRIDKVKQHLSVAVI